MPHFTKKIPAVVFLFLLLVSTSCSTSKLAMQQAGNELEIAQHNISQPYMQQPENASAEEQLAEKPSLHNEMNINHKNHLAPAPEKHRKSIKTVAKKSVQKIKKLAPDTRTLVQTASKEWKPNKQNVNINWKDVVFIIVLLGLLALLGGILHNLVGLSIVWTFIITIGLAFLVICIYLWFLHNE